MSDGEPVTVEPVPRVVSTSPGWVTPPRVARTSAGGREATPEVTIVTEVGGNDESHELNLRELMISVQPVVTSNYNIREGKIWSQNAGVAPEESKAGGTTMKCKYCYLLQYLKWGRVV